MPRSVIASPETLRLTSRIVCAKRGQWAVPGLNSSSKANRRRQMTPQTVSVPNIGEVIGNHRYWYRHYRCWRAVWASQRLK